MKVLLPDSIPLSPTVPPEWEVAVVDGRSEIPPEHHDAHALVTWWPSRRHLQSAADNMPNLRLVQSLSAGVDGIVKIGFNERVVIATGAGLHSVTVVEHTVAMLLALVRSLPQWWKNQERHFWDAEACEDQELHPHDRLTTLLDSQVLIWGFGEIGQHLAGVLSALGAHVTGVARSAGERRGFPVITEESLPQALARTDVLISILPASEKTEAIINAEVFAALPSKALFVNVGRGVTLDQPALTAALRASEIAGAALDVTDPEPLPHDDELWDAPNLLITPHIAGCRPVGADERITHNLKALTEGGEILHPAD